MHWQWITDIVEFRKISQDWDRLLIESNEDNPFLLSAFHITWWKYFSSDLSFRFLIFYENGRIIGGLPLVLDRRGNLEFPGGVAANYTEPLYAVMNRHIIWAGILEALRESDDWRCFYLKRIRRSRFDMGMLDKKASLGKKILCDIYPVEHTYLAKIPHDFHGFRDKLSQKLRYYVRRSEKEFAKLGKINLHAIKDPAELEAFLDKFFVFSRDSFKRRHSRSLFEDREYRSFFKELVKNFMEEGILDAQALRLDEKTIAIHFGYSLGKNMNYVFPAFDMDYADLNPGHLMIYKLFELGSKRKNSYFDFFSGYSFYKKQWSDIKEEVLTLKICSRSVLGSIDHFLKKKLRKTFPAAEIKEKLRTHHKLFRAAKKIRGLVYKK